MRRFARGDDEGAIIVAMLMVFAFAGLSLTLLAMTLSHVKTAKRDRAFTSVLPAGDAGIQHGLFQLNAGQSASLPSASTPETLTSGSQSTQWSAAAQSNALQSPPAPLSYTLTSTTQGTARQLKAEAFQSRRFPVAAFADRSVVFRGGNTADSYNSASGTTALTSRGRVGSNGSINLEGNATANGVDLYNWAAESSATRCRNPSGSACSSTSLNTVDDRLDINSAASTAFIAAQTSASTCTTALTTTATYALPATTACYTSLSLNGDVTVSGPTVLYVKGNVFINHHLNINYASGVVPNPSLLQIYMLGDTYDMTNHTTISAAIYAPLATCKGGAQSVVYGSLICGTISNNGGWNFHYDEALGTIGDGQFKLRNYREG